VLGLEKFEARHDRGSSHGDSRIIRETYFEHPLYVPLVQRAHALWRELEMASGRSLMTINGGLMIGPPDGTVVTGTLRSVREHRLPHEVLTPHEVARRYPPFEISTGEVAVLDPRAGYLDPEVCTQAHLELAKVDGAEVRFTEPVVSWSASERGVRVVTTNAEYEAKKLIFAVGPWTSSLVPDVRIPLEVERQTVFWFEPPAPRADYESRRFPIYAYEFKPGVICYGFPELAKGVKASVMHDGQIVATPEALDRVVTERDAAPLRAALSRVLPALAQSTIRDSTTCIFTNTPDRDFVIDFHPAHHNVLISSPCSGHGFKFASAIGEAQADLLTEGKARFDLTPFRIARFGTED
jgi:sarcosine oxidase